MIEKIVKRDGSLADFDKDKITNAVFKAAHSVGGSDKKIAENLGKEVIRILEERGKTVPTVEEIQDVVEKVLIESGHAATAKAYILYRQKRAEIREEKKKILEKNNVDEVDKVFDINALRVLKSRYLKKSEDGKLIETPKQLFVRVATHAGLANIFYGDDIFSRDKKSAPHPQENFDYTANDGRYKLGKYTLNRYHLEALKRMYDRANAEGMVKVGWGGFLGMVENGEFDNYEKDIDNFYNIMVSKKFMPNTPAIANFGNVLGMGSGCFVLGVEDSIESIMESLKQAAIIFKSGGGLGYNFSKLRPEGDIVKSTSGVASGPLSFMRLFDTMTEVIKQGGIRRGANMGILNSNHPDIEKFIKAKEGNKALRNFNISILIMPDFWEYYEKNEPYPLTNPRSGEIMRTINPRMLFDMIVYQAWESAEPGVIFFDHANKYNPFYEQLGPIVTTNPCVAADTLVSTGRGLERIDSIASENITVDARVTQGGLGQATMQLGTRSVKLNEAFRTGCKKTYKLVTKSGYELTATEDHRIMTEKGWKNLKSLTQEDNVLIQSGAGKFNENSKLPIDVKNYIAGENGRNYTLGLPYEWDYNLGLLMGWLVGDGFISNEHNILGLVFSKEDEEARRVIQPILEGYCNRAITPSKYENGCLQVRSASKFIVDFFARLGVKGSNEERRVPDSLFTATEEAVTGFLKGLFSSDGTIGMGNESRNYARLNSSSLKLLKDVQLLLLNLGIRSSIYDRFTNPKKFNYVKKDGSAAGYLTSGKNYELNISKGNLPKFLNRVGFLQKENLEKAEELQSFEFYRETFMDDVESVEYEGEKEVWDITEPLTHSFIANGMVVHNCGEVLLYPNEPCNLGSINVWAFVKEKDGATYYDWEGLKNTIRIATRFLDDVIDVNKWPTPEIENMALSTRKVGLGIMGLADLLYELRLPYNSEDGRKFMEKLMEFVNYYSKVESLELAKARGPIPFIGKSFYPQGRLPISGYDDRNNWNFDWESLVEEIKEYGIRNGYTTIIAPTGSISMIAGCSSGIEPVYTLAFEKNVAIGSFYYVDPAFEKIMREERLFDDQLIKDVAASGGTIQGVQYVPSALKKALVTAMDITPENHIRALAAFQKWTDSSISKTNNFPADATVEDMRESYLLAYRLGCKDVTVFRDSSIKNQVLVAVKREDPRRAAMETGGHAMGADMPNGELKFCKECGAGLLKKEGCLSCPSCGWGVCTTG